MTKPLITSTRSKLFGHPGLPFGLVYLVLLLIFTHACVLLMNQPAAYWLNRQYASMVLPFSFLLHNGPVAFLAIAGLYLVIAGLLLRNLRAQAGLFLAAIFGLMHSIALLQTTVCGFSTLYESHSAWGCHTYRFAPIILFFVLFTLMLLAEHLPEQWIHLSKKILIPLIGVWVLLMAYGIFRAAFPLASPWEAPSRTHPACYGI